MAENFALQGEEIGEMGSLLGLLCGGDGDLPGPEWLHQCPMSVTGSGLAAVAMGCSVAWRRLGGLDDKDDVVVEGTGSEGVIDVVTALQWVEGELRPDGDWEGVEGSGKRECSSPAATTGLSDKEVIVVEMLLVGFSSGLVRVYGVDGSIVLSHEMHDHGVKSLKLRGFSTQDQTQELLIIFDDSVVARVDGSTLISVLRGIKGWGERRARLVHCKWKMASLDVLSDVACCGLDEQAQASDFWGAIYYKIIAGGSRPSMALYAACDERTTTSAKEVLSKVTTAAWSMAKSYFWGGGKEGGGEEEEGDGVGRDSPARPGEPARSVAACDALEDQGRHIRALCLGPGGRLVAASDDLGRVLLLDVEDFFVQRMWKGYREGECAWTSVRGGVGAGRLCLLIYAPRRKILEAWHVGCGLKVGAHRFEAPTKLLQTAAMVREFRDEDAEGGEGEGEGGELEGGEEGGQGGVDCVTVDAAGRVRVWKVVGRE